MKADLIIVSDAVFDSIAEEPFPGFVATKGNRILEVGKGMDFEEWKSEEDLKLPASIFSLLQARSHMPED